MDRERLARWQRRVVEYMRDGMDPGLIAAVLFYHWLETLYMDDVLREELEPDRIQALGERLYAVLGSTPPAPLESPGDSGVDALLRDGPTAIFEQIRRMYPRRILHQRDVDRWVQRLSDELDDTMVEVAQWEGRLDTWRLVVFALWWWFKTCLENVSAPPTPVGEGVLRDLMRQAQDLVVAWLTDRPGGGPAGGTSLGE